MDAVQGLRGGNKEEIQERWEGTGGSNLERPSRELDLVNEERR